MDPKSDKLSQQREEIYEKFRNTLEQIDLGIPLGENISFLQVLNDLEAIDEAYFINRYGSSKKETPY